MKTKKEYREEVIEKYELDEDSQEILIDKITDREYKFYKSTKTKEVKDSKEIKNQAEGRKGYKGKLLKAGIDPKTGKKLKKDKNKKDSEKVVDKKSLKEEVKRELRDEAMVEKLEEQGARKVTINRLKSMAKSEKKTIKELKQQ